MTICPKCGGTGLAGSENCPRCYGQGGFKQVDLLYRPEMEDRPARKSTTKKRADSGQKKIHPTKTSSTEKTKLANKTINLISHNIFHDTRNYNSLLE